MANQRVGIDIITTGNAAGAKAVQSALVDLEQEAAKAVAAVTQVGSSAEPAAMAAARDAVEGLTEKLGQVGQSAPGAAKAVGEAGQAANHSGLGFMALGNAIQDAQYGFAGVANNLPQIITMFGGSAGLAGGVIIAAVAVQQLLSYLGKVKAPDFGEWAKEAQASGEAIKKAYADLIQGNFADETKQIAALGTAWEEVAGKAGDYLTQLQTIAAQQSEMAKAQTELEQARAEAQGIPFSPEEKAAAARQQQQADEDRALRNEEDKARLAKQQADQGLADNADIVVQAQRDQAEAAKQVQAEEEKLRQRGVLSDQERKVKEAADLEQQRAALETESRRWQKMDFSGQEDPQRRQAAEARRAYELEQLRNQISPIAQKQALMRDDVAAAQASLDAGQKTYESSDGLNPGQQIIQRQAQERIAAERARAEEAGKREAEARTRMEKAAEVSNAADQALQAVGAKRDILDTRRTTADLQDATAARAQAAGTDEQVASNVQRASQETTQSASDIGRTVEEGFSKMATGMQSLAEAVSRSVSIAEEARQIAQRAADEAARQEANRRYSGQ